MRGMAVASNSATGPIFFSADSGALMFAENMRDIRLTLAAMVYVVGCLYIAALSNSIADRINPNNLLPLNDRQTLPDPFMSLTRPIYEYLELPVHFSDDILIVCFILMFARGFTMGTRTFTTVRRVLFIVGTLYVLRAMTVVATVLPNPLLECQSTWHPNLFYDALLVFTKKRETCGDVFFSGHTIIFTLTIAIWQTYSRSTLMRVVATICGVVGMLSLIMSAYHYTIDVMVGYAVTSWAWTMYHYGATLPTFRRKWWGKILYRLDNANFYKKEGEKAVAPSSVWATISKSFL
jgi:hypothetical protein